MARAPRWARTLPMVAAVPARLERPPCRAWVLRGERSGDWYPPLNTVPWRHPEELSRLTADEDWRYLLPQSRRGYGPASFELVDERFTWTCDVRLDLRGVSKIRERVKAAVRPLGGYPEGWDLELRPQPVGPPCFRVLQQGCPELPYP